MSYEFPGFTPVNQQAELEVHKQTLSPVEKGKKMIEYCRGNEQSLDYNLIEILDPGSEIVEEPELGNFARDLDEVEREVLAMILKQANNFLHSPAFTDSFHEDHGARRSWEKSQSFQTMPEDLQTYYQSNRFNLNLLGLPYTFLELAISLAETGVLNELEEKFVQKISQDLEAASPDRLASYGLLSDEEKYKIINDLQVVFEDIVALLSKK